MENFKWFLDNYLVPIVGVILFLGVAFVAATWIGRVLQRVLERSKLDKTLSRFFGQLARWGVIVLAVIACLGVFGIQTTSFAAVLGAGVLAIGLAFQGSLSNLAAGVMLLIFRPFKVDDTVKVCGEMGVIESVTLFYTMMDTFDNRRLILPNSEIFDSTIENLTHHPTRRVDVPVGVEYGADLDRTREVLLAAARSVEGRLDDPEPGVMLLDLGDSSVNWSVRIWVNTADLWSLREELVRRVKIALDDAELGIPFPQMDVHLDAPEPIAVSRK